MSQIFIIFINVSKVQTCMNVAATAADRVSVVCIIIMVLRPMIISSDKVTHNKDELNFSVHRVDGWAIAKKCFHSFVSARKSSKFMCRNHSCEKSGVNCWFFLFNFLYFLSTMIWSWMINFGSNSRFKYRFSLKCAFKF